MLDFSSKTKVTRKSKTEKSMGEVKACKKAGKKKQYSNIDGGDHEALSAHMPEKGHPVAS